MKYWLVNHSWESFKRTQTYCGFQSEAERNKISIGDRAVYFGNGIVFGLFEVIALPDNEFKTHIKSRFGMKKDYSGWNKEELIREINSLKKRKKYGLVWDEEREPEKVVVDCKEKLPVLKEVKDKEIVTDKNQPTNILIEGDNYHALSVLNYTHKGKIDVIYIDPPYNTGNKTWKYNNAYVNKEDTFRHSKWISFIYKRLILSRNLLTRNGIFVCAIDDYEVQNLRHILDDIFGESNRLGTVVVLHNPGGRQDEEFFATAHEYMLIYAKDANCAEVQRLEISQKKLTEYSNNDSFGGYKLREFRRSGANSRRIDRPKLWYPIYVNAKNFDFSVEPFEDAVKVLPVDPKGIERVWRWNKLTLMERKDKYVVIKKRDNAFVFYVKERLLDNKGEKPKTIWNKPQYSAVNGTNELKQILGGDFEGEKIFEYPKSPALIFDVLKITGGKKSIILDFFAGSGTTGQAALNLNKEDGGNRKFILCTNDETNICSDVCYPRVEKVINGYKNSKGEKITGLGSNLKYFVTDFVGAAPTDRNKRDLVNKCTEMLCLKENAFELVKKGDNFRIFKDSHKHLGIIYDEESISEFKKEAKKINGNFVVYVFSLDQSAHEERFKDMKGKVKLNPIPEVILAVYRRIFK